MGLIALHVLWGLCVQVIADSVPASSFTQKCLQVPTMDFQAEDWSACPGDPFPHDCLSSSVRWQIHLSQVNTCFKCCLQWWSAVVNRTLDTVKGASVWKSLADVVVKKTLEIVSAVYRTGIIYVDDARDQAFGQLECWLRNMRHVSFVVVGSTDHPNFHQVLDHPNVLEWYHPNMHYKKSKECHPRYNDMHVLFLGLPNPNFWKHELLTRHHINVTQRANQMMVGAIQWRRPRVWAFHGIRFHNYNMTGSLNQQDYISILTNSKAVMSPMGRGKQNFRDAEALYAGAIACVDHFLSLLPLWEGLPVWPVLDWRKATPTLLEEKVKYFLREDAAGRVRFEKIFFPFWFGTVTNRTLPTILRATREPIYLTKQCKPSSVSSAAPRAPRKECLRHLTMPERYMFTFRERIAPRGKKGESMKTHGPQYLNKSVPLFLDD